MTTLTTEVLDTGQKRDTRGRRMVAPEERAVFIAAYEQSGLTQRAFAKREGIKFCTFASWLGKRRRYGPRGAKGVFAEVNVRGARLPIVIEVVMPDGVVVRGSDPEQVGVVVDRLRRC